LNGHYRDLLDEEGFKKKDKKVEVVTLHEDIFKILAALYSKEEPVTRAEGETDIEYSERRNKQLTTQAKELWAEIFNYELKITYEHRLFSFFDKGDMVNEDGKRNVAFKTETFLRFLNQFHDTLRTYLTSERIYTAALKTALLKAGEECGTNFGESLVDMWTESGECHNSREWKIEEWCKFDTRAGFGQLSYNKEINILNVKNLFIYDPDVTNTKDKDGRIITVREYTDFFQGYAEGVLRSILGESTLNLTLISLPDSNASKGFSYRI
jgi:hypothetical protein